MILLALYSVNFILELSWHTVFPCIVLYRSFSDYYQIWAGPITEQVSLKNYYQIGAGAITEQVSLSEYYQIWPGQITEHVSLSDYYQIWAGPIIEQVRLVIITRYGLGQSHSRPV